MKNIDQYESQFMESDSVEIESHSLTGIKFQCLLIVNEVQRGARCGCTIVSKEPDGNQIVTSNVIVDFDGEARKGAWLWVKKFLKNQK